MRVKKLIQSIADFLNLNTLRLIGKKRSLKKLLKKLKEKRVSLLRALQNECTREEEKLLREE